MLIGVMQFPGYSDYRIFLGEHREPLREALWFHIVPLFFIKLLTVPSGAGYKEKIPRTDSTSTGSENAVRVSFPICY
jgi:hypothetical protein